MRKVVRTMVSMLLIAALLGGSFNATCLAAEAGDVEIVEDMPEVLEAEVIEGEEGIMPYTSFAQCIISVSGHEEGMYIDITTGVIGIASVIGVKDIKIQKKVWYGWSTVAVSSGGEITDRTMMLVCITYANAVKDATYRIICTHYADVNGYAEGVNDTGGFVYTY